MTIVQALERTNWNKQEAAAQLGLYRPTLYSKMRKHKIPDEGRGRRAGGSRAPRVRPGMRDGRSGACVIGRRCWLDSSREPSSAAPRAGSF